MYLRAVALAHGHSPATINEMQLKDLEALAAFTAVELQMPHLAMGE
jgi:hypothetical protein